MKLFLCALLGAVSLFAQPVVDDSGAAGVIPWPQREGGFPGVCTPGQKLTRTDMPYGQNDFTCGPDGKTWVPTNRSFGFGYNFPAGAVAGATAYMVVPFGCTIQNWSITVTSGTATIDIWKLPAGTAIPTVSNSIVGATLPAISSGNVATSSSLSGWLTTTVTAFDVLAFNLNAISGTQAVSIVLGCR